MKNKVLDTDIILEILDVKFDIHNPVKNFKIREKGLNTTFNNWNGINYVDCQLAMNYESKKIALERLINALLKELSPSS